VVAPALLIGDMASMRASITNEALDPNAWVDPQTSTLQAVR